MNYTWDFCNIWFEHLVIVTLVWQTGVFMCATEQAVVPPVQWGADTLSEQETLNRPSISPRVLHLLSSCPTKPYLLSTSCRDKEKQWLLRIEAVLTHRECVSRVIGQVLGKMRHEKGSSWGCHIIVCSQCIRTHCALWLATDYVCQWRMAWLTPIITPIITQLGSLFLNSDFNIMLK